MRYTKTALLGFGLGLVLGLAVVAAEIRSLERLASGLMALGIGAIPIALILDWRRGKAMQRPPRRAKAPARRTRPPARRRRKPALPKR
jgi:hypothetical protein